MCVCVYNYKYTILNLFEITSQVFMSVCVWVPVCVSKSLFLFSCFQCNCKFIYWCLLINFPIFLLYFIAYIFTISLCVCHFCLHNGVELNINVRAIDSVSWRVSKEMKWLSWAYGWQGQGSKIYRNKMPLNLMCR